MRVDKDWEEGIGKKLYDFEGELSPQDWSNINKRLKPRRNYRYFWLPALLFFLTLPTALYFTDSLSWLQPDDQHLSPYATKPSSEKIKTGASKTVGFQGEKPELNANAAASETDENAMHSDGNAMHSEEKTLEANEKAVAQITNTSTGNPKAKPGNKPTENLLAGGFIPTKRPGVKATEVKENTPSEAENSAPGSGVSPTIIARAGNQSAGTLALYKTEELQLKNVKKAKAGSENSAAKTVGFDPEKPEAVFAKETTLVNAGALNLEALKNATNPNAETGKTTDAVNPNEMAWLEVKLPALAGSSTFADYKETLPDSLKKQLLSTLPAPENVTTQKDKKQEKTAAGKWAFAVYGSPHYTFQRVLPNQKDDRSILQLKNKNAFEKERFGYEFGFRAYYPVRKNLQLILGFQAARINQHLRLSTMKMTPDSAVITKESIGVTMQVYNTARQEEHLFRYYFGGIFTGLQLSLSEKLNLSGGLGMNWLLQSKTANENTTVPTSAFNPYLNLGLQYKQPLNQKLTFMAGPTMQYFLLPVQEKQAFVGVKPTTIGFSVGLQYKP